MVVNHQGNAKEEKKVEKVAPGENQGLEVVVDRRSDRQTRISQIVPFVCCCKN